jgi:hypothetical protein
MKKITWQDKQKIHSIYDHIGNVRHLLQGGCGVFTKHLYLKLVSLGYEPEIILHLEDGSTENYQEKFEELKSRHGNKIYGYDLSKEFINWFHLSIRIDGGFYDSRFPHELLPDKKFIVINIDILKTMLSVKHSWNYKFDRIKETPKIKRALDKAFS